MSNPTGNEYPDSQAYGQKKITRHRGTGMVSALEGQSSFRLKTRMWKNRLPNSKV